MKKGRIFLVLAAAIAGLAVASTAHAQIVFKESPVVRETLVGKKTRSVVWPLPTQAWVSSFLVSLPAGGPSCTPARGSVFNVDANPTTVNCSATVNLFGFPVTVSGAFPVNLVPGVAPVITKAQGNITQTLPNFVGQKKIAFKPALPQATDNFFVASKKCTPPSGTIFKVGKRVVTCVLKDGVGNITTHKFTVWLKTRTGVVKRRYISGSATSGPAATLNAGRQAIFAHWVFSTRAPKAITVTWFRNGGKLGSVQLRPVGHVMSRIASRSGLRAGKYTAVAKVNGISLGATSVRLR